MLDMQLARTSLSGSSSLSPCILQTLFSRSMLWGRSANECGCGRRPGDPYPPRALFLSGLGPMVVQRLRKFLEVGQNRNIFPMQLQPMLKRKKQDLFAIWLDSDQSWDRVEMEVERLQQSTNLARKEWCAVQAKVLKASMDEAKYQDLLKKRVDAGLYYKDDDYPDDPEDLAFSSFLFYAGECSQLIQPSKALELFKNNCPKHETETTTLQSI